MRIEDPSVGLYNPQFCEFPTDFAARIVQVIVIDGDADFVRESRIVQVIVIDEDADFIRESRIARSSSFSRVYPLQGRNCSEVILLNKCRRNTRIPDDYRRCGNSCKR
jgi:hypothetical protein